MPKYILTPKQLAQSLNAMVLKLRNKDLEFAWTKDGKMEIGWTDLLKDVMRNAMVNHSLLEEEERDILEALQIKISKTGDKTKFSELTEAFKTLLHVDPNDEEQASQVEALLLHYSQAPGILLATTLGDSFEGTDHLILKGPEGAQEKQSKRAPKPAAVKQDIYMDQGKINIKFHIERLPIVDLNQDGAKVLYLEGPVEGLFELDLDKGFVLKQIATDSKYMAELYMGESKEYFELIHKFQELEEKLLKEDEKIKKQIEASPKEATNLMREKRHIEVVLESLDDYRKRKISLERVADRIRYHGNFMAEMNFVEGAATFRQLAEVLNKLRVEPEKQLNHRESKTSHSTFPSHIKPGQEISNRDPIPLHFKEARGLMHIASDAAIQIVKEFREKNPEPTLSAMFSSYVYALGSEHDQAKRLIKAAQHVFQDEMKSKEYSDVDTLRNYLNFVTVLVDVIKNLDSSSTLLAEINAKRLMVTVGESIGVLIWKKLDPNTVSQIEASLQDHVKWMQDILPEAKETLKGKIQ